MLDLQGFMDRVVEVIRADDLEGYLDMIALPYQVITATSTLTFRRQRDMEDHFHLFRLGLREMGFRDLSHHVISTTMLGASLATGIYETRLVREDRRLVAPYRSCITLRKNDDRWRAVSTAHTIGHADWISRMEAIAAQPAFTNGQIAEETALKTGTGMD